MKLGIKLPLPFIYLKYCCACSGKIPRDDIIWRSFQFGLCHLEKFWRSRSMKTMIYVV